MCVLENKIFLTSEALKIFWGPQKRLNFRILDLWECLEKLGLEPTVLEILSCIYSTTSDNYRYQNIYLVPKSFDIYRVRCIYGGALLEPPKCYKIPEKHPPNLSNSSSDVYVVWLFNKVFCWLWRNLSNLKTGLPRICHIPHFFINYSISRLFFAVQLIAFQDIFRDE